MTEWSKYPRRMLQKQAQETALKAMTKDEVRAEMLRYLRPGETVYSVTRHTTRTNIHRHVDLFLIHTTEWTTRLLSEIGRDHNHEACDCEFCVFRSAYFNAHPYGPGPISISLLTSWVLELGRTKEGYLITGDSPEITVGRLAQSLFNDVMALKHRAL